MKKGAALSPTSHLLPLSCAQVWQCTTVATFLVIAVLLAIIGFAIWVCITEEK